MSMNRHLIFREAMQSTTLGHAAGSFCVRLLSMSCHWVVFFNRKGRFIPIITTRYATNATFGRGTQTGFDSATFESEGKSNNHLATTRLGFEVESAVVWASAVSQRIWDL